MRTIPFYKPSISEAEIQEVVDCLRTGWLTTGPKAKQFETEFSRYVQHAHAVAVNSCTAALHLALEAIGLKAGQTVVVPTMTFAATAEVVRYFDASPLFVDCRPDDLNLDVADAAQRIEAALAKGAQPVAIIPVHYGGQIGDVAGVAALSERFNLKIIEDAAHCCPAYYRENEIAPWKSVGTSAAISCFSFYANKNITTGEGGMACTGHSQYAERMRIMSLHGISRDAWKRYTQEGSWFYEIVAPGYKYNLTDIAAAIGLHQVRRADELHQKRTERACLYSELLQDVDELILPRVMPNRIHSWHLYPVRLKLDRLKLNRAALISELKSAGIGASVHWMPLHMHPYYRDKFGCAPADYPCAASIYWQLISLPLYPEMTTEEVKYVCSTLKESIARAHGTQAGFTVTNAPSPLVDTQVNLPAEQCLPPAQVSDPAGTPAGGTRSPRLDLKRLYDIVLSASGLILLGPIFLVIAALSKLSTKGDIFYSQIRVGRYGRPFRILKFRTMVAGADRSGPSVTREGDARITSLGRILRRTKLDEMPQLWNVLKGEMSLVGPRPEVPQYVAHYTSDQLAILKHAPGITDLASLYFRNEERLLRNVSNVEAFYLEHCLPRKLTLNRIYAERASLLTDTWIVLQTLCPYWIGVLAVYAIILFASFWLSDWLLLDFAPVENPLRHFQQSLLVVVLQLGCLVWRNQCQGLLSYFSVPEVRQVGAALGLASLISGLGSLLMHGWLPRNLIAIDFLLSFFLLSGFRLLLRHWRENVPLLATLSPKAEGGGNQSSPPIKVGIIGAGSIGARIASELMVKNKSGRTVVAFFDDDYKKWHKRIHEVPVVGMPECLLEAWRGKLDEVVIAIPSASPTRISQVSKLLQTAGLKSYTAFSSRTLWTQPNGRAATV